MTAAGLKPTLDQLPGAAQLKTFLYFNDADAQRQALYGQVMQLSEWSGPGGMLERIPVMWKRSLHVGNNWHILPD